MFCAYRDALGKPNEGVHKHFLGIAIVDLMATVIVSFLIAFLLGNWIWGFAILLGLLVLGILLHRLFCVNTTINKIIFGVI